MRMNALMAVAALAVAITAAGSPTEARPVDEGSSWSSRHSGSVASNRKPRAQMRAERADRSYKRRYASRSRYAASGHHGVGPRPAKWCGWWMRTQKGGGPQYNVAYNWRKYGRAGSPQIGAVVVWRHHVGMITGRAANGQWIVTAGNESGRVRSRARSLKGAIIRV